MHSPNGWCMYVIEKVFFVFNNKMKKSFKMKWIGLAACVLLGLFTVSCNKEEKTIFRNSDWVDLGLPSGLLWATRNVGATSPEDYGDYFAWGETQSNKQFYDGFSYIYMERGDHGFLLTKYCNDPLFGYNGFTDNLTILQPGDDAATANFGGRTPTKEEWEELMNNTTATWTTQNGVNGLLFTAINGNSLFLPAAGYHYGNSPDFYGRRGHYWSSSLYTDSPYYAWRFHFKSDYQMVQEESRYFGFPVRAVRQK